RPLLAPLTDRRQSTSYPISAAAACTTSRVSPTATDRENSGSEGKAAWAGAKSTATGRLVTDDDTHRPSSSGYASAIPLAHARQAARGAPIWDVVDPHRRSHVPVRSSSSSSRVGV